MIIKNVLVDQLLEVLDRIPVEISCVDLQFIPGKKPKLLVHSSNSDYQRPELKTEDPEINPNESLLTYMRMQSSYAR